jgi:hypothetical protein
MLINEKLKVKISNCILIFICFILPAILIFSFLFFIGTKDPYYIQPAEYNTDSKGRYVNEEGRYFDGANWREL